MEKIRSIRGKNLVSSRGPCGVWILFKPVEDAKIEESQVIILMLIPQVYGGKWSFSPQRATRTQPRPALASSRHTRFASHYPGYPQNVTNKVPLHHLCSSARSESTAAWPWDPACVEKLAAAHLWTRSRNAAALASRMTTSTSFDSLPDPLIGHFLALLHNTRQDSPSDFLVSKASDGQQRLNVRTATLKLPGLCLAS